jgi:hypothetical protein
MGMRINGSTINLISLDIQTRPPLLISFGFMENEDTDTSLLGFFWCAGALWLYFGWREFCVYDSDRWGGR